MQGGRVAQWRWQAQLRVTTGSFGRRRLKEITVFQQILVAVDGTSTSTGALAVAAALATESKGTLHLLHVIDESLTTQGFTEVSSLDFAHTDEVLRQLRASGRAILGEAEKTAVAKGAQVNPLLISGLYGNVASAVLLQAREVRADLIVMGTHGRRGLTRVLMGSDAETVLRESTVPVLLVRAPVESKASKKQAASKKPKRGASRRRVHLSIVPPGS